ncbi:hypothetical protein MLD38_012615 [Melastoma candidum]|nr:hypothetical protein MLD38_012615 [Melastoma candidum]
MASLAAIFINSDPLVMAALLKFYSSLALCGYGAIKFLESGDSFLAKVMHSLGSCHPQSVRIVGFKLAQRVMINENECSRMINLFAEPIVEATVSAMSHEGKIAAEKIPLVVEACRFTAVIARWPGKHHICFWRLGIGKVLLNMLIQHPYRSHTFGHILGSLVIHCDDSFHPQKVASEVDVEILVISACLAFEERCRRGPRFCDDDVTTMTRHGMAARAVLMMMHSSCEYFSYKARALLLQILETSGQSHINDLIVSLGYAHAGISKLHFLITVTNLMGFTCYMAVPEYRRFSRQGAECLLSLITDHLSRSDRLCLSNESLFTHLKDVFLGIQCCWSFSKEWEGSDLILFYSLWGLTECLQQCALEDNCPTLPVPHDKNAKIIGALLDTCRINSTCGSRWFAAFVLTFFGYYGFPNEVGERLSVLLDRKEFIDTKFILADGDTLDAHGILLALGCPSLLPPETPATGGHCNGQ